jgi:hypothetical protein
MDYEAILLKAQQKAQKIANKVEKALRKDNEIDPEELATHFAEKLFKKEPTTPPEVLTEKNIRLDYNLIKSLYEKTGIKPGASRYWFSEDYPNNPLIQISRLNDQKTQGTPIAALCLLSRKEILEGKEVPEYLKKNSIFVDTPSNQWCLGQISQLTGLSCSYILGFNNGYDGNTTLHKNCTVEAHQGYEDGLVIRKKFIEEGLLIEEADAFTEELDPGKIAELLRVGYYTTEQEEIDGNNGQHPG